MSGQQFLNSSPGMEQGSEQAHHGNLGFFSSFKSLLSQLNTKPANLALEQMEGGGIPVNFPTSLCLNAGFA